MEHELFLIRHGQTEWSVNGRHTGHTDIPLTPAGENQARAVGLTLGSMRKGPALVISSPRRRAVRTAELAGLLINETTEELAEWNYGDYEGITTQEIRKTTPDWTIWHGPVPGGETGAEVAARADKLLDRVRAALADTEVILVGHGHFSRVLVARWLDLPASRGVNFGLDPAGVTVLSDERGEPKIEHLNIPPS